jgi:hypothetical protein
MAAPQSLPETLTFSGRTFSLSELELIRQIASDFASLGVTEISRTICELLEWKRPGGGLKNIECRQLLERLQERGLLRLPELRGAGSRGPRVIRRSSSSDPQPDIQGSAGEFDPLQLELVRGGRADRSGNHALFKELLDRYHYLGYRTPVGANLRYLVRSSCRPEQVLACLLWSSPAWKMAARDQWIGWSDTERARNLQYIVNHSRFLILPWVQVKGLASKILAYCTRRLPEDWEQLYGYRPLLLETLVDAARFRGVCYRAANWIELGQTQGRGRMDRYHQAHGRAPKLLYVYPLCRHVQQRLRNAAAPAYVEPVEPQP